MASVLHLIPSRGHGASTGAHVHATKFTALTPSLRQRLARAGGAEETDLPFVPRNETIALISRAFPQFSLNRARTALLRAAGISMGAGTLILGALRVTGYGPASLLSFGCDTIVSGPLRVHLGARVSIGHRVHIGRAVRLLTMEYAPGRREERCDRLAAAPICIEDGVVIAAGVTILHGVTVGRGSIVAAGSVVASDVPAHTLVGGSPARWIRNLDDRAI